MRIPNDLFLDLARQGRHFPIATDLVLRESPQGEEALRDGEALGQVMRAAADRYRSPLALPVMDLQTEKTELLSNWFGVSEADCPAHHLDAVPSDTVRDEVAKGDRPLSPRLRANAEAIRHVTNAGDKVPCGMTIGPFSLATKMLASPIEPAYLVGMGMDADDEEEVALLLRALELASLVIERSLAAQIEAGAKVVFIAEPAANLAYISPNQMESGSDVFRRLVTEPNRKVAEQLDRAGVLRIFHCCGEIDERILAEFTGLLPHVLSLGSSRDLPTDAALVPEDIVLYGNLPSKSFYSDELIRLEEVRDRVRELDDRMMRTGHPYLLGTECDVLSVPGCEATLMAKVMALVER